MLCIVSALGLRAQGWTAQAPADGDFYLYNVGSGTFLSCGSEYWGSKACIDNGALNFTLASNGEGAYTLYTTSTFSYGNPNAAQLQSSGYVDQNKSATTWTFAAVGGMENTYTMQNAAGTYLVAPSDGTKSILLSNDAPTTNYGYWKLINKANLFPETASENNPADITCLIGDASFESTQDAMENFWTIVAANNNLKQDLNGGLIPNNVLESWKSKNGFTLSQTITVPNGYYRLTAQTFCREYTATGADLPYIYLNDVKKDFNLMGTETASLGGVAGYFSNGDNGNYYNTSTDVVTVSTKSITLGAKGTRTNTWNVVDNFKLYYLGPIDLSTFVTALADAVAAAEATEGTIPTAAYNAIAAVVTEKNKSYDNEDDYSAAITAINDAVSTYASAEIVAAYASYNNVRAAVLAVDGSIDVTAADDLANDGTDANLDDAVAAVRTALKNYLKTTDKTNVSLTAALLINPSFETGDFTGWTNNNMALQTNTSFGKDGNVYCEKWVPDGTFGVSQTITAMPAGVYQVTAKAKARGVTSAKLSAGGIEKAITIGDSESDYAVEFAIDDNSDITIAFEGVGTKAGSSWLVVDNFRLMLVSAGLPEVVAVTGKMNAEVEAVQTTAINTYNSNPTVANYNAAAAAISAAETSKAAYAVAATALADANTLKDAHNFASSAAITTFADAIAAVQTKYNNGTLTNDEANAGGNLGMRATGWHAGNNTPAAVYLRDGFALGDFAADPALHVNTWSTEGDTDGSNFSVPFYESWTADTNSLPESTVSGTISGLPNGLYSISAWVRVVAKTGVNATDAAGITMDVNGGSAVDVTEGTQIGTTQRSIETYVAEGFVRQGRLTLNFNIAADANISWLAFKNVKYTKVRDLTSAEEAPATVKDYAALNTAIANAEAKTLGFDEGDYAPYNNITVLAALAAAKAIDPEGDNAHVDVVAATNAIADSEWNVNVEEVNAVYDGTFAAAINNDAPKGWRMSNNTLGGDLHSRAYVGNTRLSEFNGTNSGLFLRFDGTNSDRGSMYYYGDTKNYTMPLKKDVTYYAKVDFTNWGTSSSMPLRMYVTGPDGFTATGLTVNSTKNADTGSDTPDQILFVFMPNVAGNYVINFQCPGSDDNKHNVVISNVEVMRAASATMKTFKAGTYGTFIAPFDVTIPSGVTASKVTGHTGNTLELTDLPGTIPANTPVVVKGTDAIEQTFYGKNTASEDSYEEGLLVGVYTNAAVPVGSYVLQTQGGVQGFYKVSTALTAVPNRAYLKAGSLDDAVKAYFFDQTDAVRSLQAEEVAEGTIYNLSGQRVQKAQKGIYIVNGKKAVIK